MIEPLQLPDEHLQPFIKLAQEIRNAAAQKDYVSLGTLLMEHLNSDLVEVMLYIHSQRGHLTILGGYIQMWSPQPVGTIGREPSLGEMALILQAAARNRNSDGDRHV
jgi:hypothetical protein